MTFTFDTGMLIALEDASVRRGRHFARSFGAGLCLSCRLSFTSSGGAAEVLADAVVMASAALRGGGVLYTSDEADLRRLQRHFPTVLVLPV